MRIISFALLCLAVFTSIIPDSSTVQPLLNCFITTLSGECQECSFGFTLQNGTCVAAMQNCKTYNPQEGVCTSCYVGYLLTSASACVVNTGANLLVGCGSHINGTCLVCSDNYYFNYDGNCEPIDPLCLKFDYLSHVCIYCQLPAVYHASWGHCVNTTAKILDPQCTSYVGDTDCRRCQNGFMLHGFCEYANSNCRSADPSDPLTCLSCFYGMVLSQGSCLPVNQNPQCASFAPNGTCTSCLFKTIKNSVGICVAVNPLCLTYDQNGYCLSCYANYTLHNRTCVISAHLQANPYCLTWSNTKCLLCNVWSYLDQNNLCQPANVVCKSFVVSTGKGECSSCYGGWTPTRDGSCVPKSTDPCLQYSSNGMCMACREQFQVTPQQGRCQIQKQPCALRDSFGNCTKCFLNNYLDDGKCIEIDPLCYRFNFATKQCSHCYSSSVLISGKCIRSP